MTLITYKDGVLAADRNTFADNRIFYYKSKICETDDFMHASAGYRDASSTFFEYYKKNLDYFFRFESKREKIPEEISFLKGENFSSFVINKKTKELIILSFNESCFYFNKAQLYNRGYALGICEEFAEGMMFAGKTAVDTIKLIREVCPEISKEVDFVDLNKNVPCKTKRKT